jgi:hypothetical protein
LNGKVAAPGLENREYGRGDPPHSPRHTFYQQNLALTSPTSGGRLVGTVYFRTKVTEFFVLILVAALTLFIRLEGDT